tara:strand:+ start:212 stop:481 length:270 start_codon:yes stop_codon:yes gene_type:complete
MLATDAVFQNFYKPTGHKPFFYCNLTQYLSALQALLKKARAKKSVPNLFQYTQEALTLPIQKYKNLFTQPSFIQSTHFLLEYKPILKNS